MTRLILTHTVLVVAATLHGQDAGFSLVDITQRQLLETIDGGWLAYMVMEVQDLEDTDWVALYGDPAGYGMPLPMAFRRFAYMWHVGKIYRLTNRPSNATFVARDVDTNVPRNFSYFQIDSERVLLGEMALTEGPVVARIYLLVKPRAIGGLEDLYAEYFIQAEEMFDRLEAR